MWVVKIGGSLQGSRHLQDWLDTLLERGKGKVVIVAGGGDYADRVRRDQRLYNLDDLSAHRRAIQATEEFARDMQQICPALILADSIDAIRACLSREELPVWLPSAMMLDNVDLPASWEVTSDSMAAWLANELGFEGLFLVKSTALPADHGSLMSLSEAQMIDAYFPVLCKTLPLRTYWLKQDEYQRFPKANTRRVPAGIPSLQGS